MSATDWELDGYEALVSELRASPPVAPERLRQRVLDGASASRRRTSPRRRLVFVVVPVAVALAVGAAFVHGFVSSGSQHGAAAQARPHAVAANTPAKETLTGSPAATVASSGKVLQSATRDSLHVYSGVHATVDIPKDRLVHAVATLQVQVPSHSALSEATNNATKIVSSLGGYAQSVQ